MNTLASPSVWIGKNRQTSNRTSFVLWHVRSHYPANIPDVGVCLEAFLALMAQRCLLKIYSSLHCYSLRLGQLKNADYFPLINASPRPDTTATCCPFFRTGGSSLFCTQPLQEPSGQSSVARHWSVKPALRKSIIM